MFECRAIRKAFRVLARYAEPVPFLGAAPAGFAFRRGGPRMLPPGPCWPRRAAAMTGAPTAATSTSNLVTVRRTSRFALSQELPPRCLAAERDVERTSPHSGRYGGEAARERWLWLLPRICAAQSSGVCWRRSTRVSVSRATSFLSQAREACCGRSPTLPLPPSQGWSSVHSSSRTRSRGCGRASVWQRRARRALAER